jgi:hypothetical protein
VNLYGLKYSFYLFIMRSIEIVTAELLQQQKLKQLARGQQWLKLAQALHCLKGFKGFRVLG